MKKIAVILSGCGYLDGAEIRESVLSMLYIDANNAKAFCFAPNIDQHHVINHLTKEETKETRNVLAEAARIARSDIKPLSDLDAKNFDALIVPGGYGVAKNLSNLAFKGASAEVLPEFKQKLEEFLQQAKPIGLICIAPAVGVAALKQGVVTIGTDEGTASAINAMGGKHITCQTDEICIDEERKIVSTPAYMHDDRISVIASGIEKLVRKVVELA